MTMELKDRLVWNLPYPDDPAYVIEPERCPACDWKLNGIQVDYSGEFGTDGEFYPWDNGINIRRPDDDESALADCGNCGETVHVRVFFPDGSPFRLSDR